LRVKITGKENGKYFLDCDMPVTSELLHAAARAEARSHSRMAEKATRPRSGLQPGVAQRHERRHAGSKE